MFEREFFSDFPGARHFHARFHGRRGRHPGFVRIGAFVSRERGSVKYEVLAVLWEGPRHGYDIMLAIEERRGYRPSPGSIYPALQMLEDEECVTGKEVDGKRVYTITEKGGAMLEKYRQDRPEGDEGSEDLHKFAASMARGMGALHGLKDALKQIARSGSMELIGRATEIVDRARRELYALLAEEI